MPISICNWLSFIKECVTMKKLVSICLGFLVVVSSMVIVFAQITKLTGNKIPDSSLIETGVQPRSFYRSWGGKKTVTGKEWKKVCWDINTKNEEDFEIYLEDDGGYPLYFNLQVNNVDHEFCLSSGETERIHVEGGGSFSLFAQYIHHNESGIPKGTIAFGNVSNN